MTPAANSRGFTIVELLIVIVVIGILATITIVAYNGIQNRANDTAVQSDLRNLANILEMEYAKEENVYPSPVSSSHGFKATKNSYRTDGMSHNLSYCYIDTETSPSYVVLAMSKSGTAYYISNIENRPQEFTGTWGDTPSAACRTIIPEIDTFWRGYGDGTWRDWTG